MSPTKTSKSYQFSCAGCGKRTRSKTSGAVLCTTCQIKRQLRDEILQEDAGKARAESTEAVKKRLDKQSADRRYDVADAFGLDLYEGNALVRILKTGAPREERIKDLERAMYYVERKINHLRSGGNFVAEAPRD